MCVNVYVSSLKAQSLPDLFLQKILVAGDDHQESLLSLCQNLKMAIILIVHSTVTPTTLSCHTFFFKETL